MHQIDSGTELQILHILRNCTTAMDNKKLEEYFLTNERWQCIIKLARWSVAPINTKINRRTIRSCRVETNKLGEVQSFDLKYEGALGHIYDVYMI